MKRKLNALNAPEVASATGGLSSSTGFESFGLDARLLQGIRSEGFSKPTRVQEEVIPHALHGKDLLVRSKTGSGKTGAYLLPLLHSILKRKTTGPTRTFVSALILVPTKELAGQVTRVIASLSRHCVQDVRAENLSLKETDTVQRARVASLPDIIVTTPGQAVLLVNAAVLALDSLSYLVVDEADLILSYDYKDDLESISRVIPSGVQTLLISATLRSEIDDLSGLFCKDPIVVSLDDQERDAGTVSQYVVRCAEDEKFLLIYAIFMLKLIKGKVIVFVGDVDRCYRLKLFLEQFGIKSCVLNSELPVNSRIHVVEEFNKNVYNIIIATDEHEILGDEGFVNNKKTAQSSERTGTTGGESVETSGDGVETNGGVQPDSVEAKLSDQPSKKRRVHKRDKDYGVSRGIDFKNVSCVLNFDLPTSSKSYTHRIGRTARAGQTGMALSFVIPPSQYRKHKRTSFPTTQHDEDVLAKIVKSQEKKGHQIEDYKFDMKRLEGFRYRLNDALKAVTTVAVKEARVRELRQELIKSEKLKRHFEENPEDLRHLRHDTESHAARVQSHMKHVPEYLLPNGNRKGATSDVGFVGLRKAEGEGNRIRKARMKNRTKGKPKGSVNPLQTFRTKKK